MVAAWTKAAITAVDGDTDDKMDMVDVGGG